MKIAFIENRFKTIFWDAIAEKLIGNGHEIIWLVQNRVFSPSHGRVRIIPYPAKSDFMNSNKFTCLEFISTADRNINYFNGDNRHYLYYFNYISEWLDEELPDLVIGECTLFHELMTVSICRERKIPYWHPSVPGYPGGRFSIYRNDTKDALAINREQISGEECLRLASLIANRERVPDYMRTKRVRNRIFKNVINQTIVLRGYLGGERFNTPSPFLKYSLDRKKRGFLQRWQETFAARSALRSKYKYCMLYPLQMQPEANIDIWGQAYRDQAKLIRTIADNLPSHWCLLVKLNPKAKYELTNDLFACFSSGNIMPADPSLGMAGVLEGVALVCTVTGTIGVECVLSGKPVVELGPTITEDERGTIKLSDVSEIGSVLQQVEQGAFPIANNEDRITLIRRMYETTLPGIISDPVNAPKVMDRENVELVSSSLLKVIGNEFAN